MKSARAATSGLNGDAITPQHGMAGRPRAMWAVAALSLGVAATVAPATTIDWVQWTNDSSVSGPGAVLNGTGSGLTVTGTFTHKPTAGWQSATATISDSDWPYSNTSVEYWAFVQQNLSTTATYDFSNTGGLAAGGSLALIDVEHGNTSIQVRGYRETAPGTYTEVAVTWAYNVFTITPTSSQAIWNSSTNTLSGAGGVYQGGVDTFSMLTSDTQLDRVVLTIFTTADDGMGIAFTQGNIDAAVNAVPGAGVAGLATLGLAGLARRRRR